MPPAASNPPTLALAAMPWPPLNRPSIQLATLKAYVERQTGARVLCLHPYLQIAQAVGIDTYNRIAETGWAGDALFASLLFPDQSHQAERLFGEVLGRTARKLSPFSILKQRVEDGCARWLRDTDLTRCMAIGFSLCFNQLLASLLMASRLKEIPGCPPIIFGGSLCAGSLGQSLLDHFPQIDYIVDGEGETPLTGLVRLLTGETDTLPERVFCRDLAPARTPAPEIDKLDSLPTPDFTPYFKQIRQVFPDQPFIPVLPLEFSRGCWWNRCRFCNLNLQWHGYRQKTAPRVLAELEELTSRHACLDYAFTDNALPPRESERFFARLADGDIDYRFFAEIRAGCAERLGSWRRGGLDTVQVGIEALSSGLLARMDKGVRVIDNVAVMRAALACGIRLEANLIVEFPGSTSAEVAETLDALEYMLPFAPLTPAVFFLGSGSPVAMQPECHGIACTTLHPKYKKLFPPTLLDSLELLVRGYRGDRLHQRRLWRGVTQRLAAWRTFHRQRTGNRLPPLCYRDGGSFLLIRQEQPDRPVLRHRLQGTSRAIYLFCDTIRTFAEIMARFEHLEEPPLRAFLQELCRKRLMFREEDRYLCLAVREPGA